MSDRTPVILDTDIGSDIDDAVCLSYLLAQPRCELVGITTVSGQDPRERASLADAVCRAGGRTDIPIHSGLASRIVTGEVVQPQVPQGSILARFPHRAPGEFASGTAVRWLHDTISARPGEITLLGIGPMTNIAALFAMDPAIAGKLKSLVLMCGVFFNDSAWRNPTEWNALCDPAATAITYRGAAPDHRSIGLDVTTKVTMPCKECVDRFRSRGGPLAVVAAMTEVWAHHAPSVTFHDPLASACIFRPELCTWIPGRVTVELASKRLEGFTYFDRDAKGPHLVAEKVDADAFFKEYLSITGA